MITRALKRRITAARHDEQCCIALAVETMASEPYADDDPNTKRTGELCGYMTRAGEARARVDQYLDELGARLRIATS
jgi:hypothetical protein